MSAVSITSTVASPEKTDHNLLTSVHHRGLTTHFSRRICGPRLAHYSPPKPSAQWFHPPVCGDSPSPSAPLSPPRLGRRARIEFPVRTGINHLGIRFVSIQDQIDTTSPMGKAMFTLIGAMAELESSLISERVTAGMKAAKARGKHLGRPRTPVAVVARIEELAKTTDLSVRDIHRGIGAQIGRGVVGDIVKRVRHSPAAH